MANPSHFILQSLIYKLERITASRPLAHKDFFPLTFCSHLFGDHANHGLTYTHILTCQLHTDVPGFCWCDVCCTAVGPKSCQFRQKEFACGDHDRPYRGHHPRGFERGRKVSRSIKGNQATWLWVC